MGTLSAVAISIWLIIYGLVYVYAAVFALYPPTPAAAKAVAIIGIFAAVIVLLDTFWFNTGAKWAAYRNRQA